MVVSMRGVHCRPSDSPPSALAVMTPAPCLQVNDHLTQSEGVFDATCRLNSRCFREETD